MQCSHSRDLLIKETSVIEDFDINEFTWSVAKYSKDDENWRQVQYFHRRAWGLNWFIVLVSTALLGFLTYQDDVRESLEVDSCSKKLSLSCVDIGLNLALFCILLPLIFKFGSTPRWNVVLYLIFTFAVGLDVALFGSSFGIRKYAFVSMVLSCIGVLIIWIHLWFPDPLVGWKQASILSCLASTFAGLIMLIWLSTSYAYTILVAIFLNLYILACFRFVCEHVSPREYITASLFLFFPEGLACLASRGEHHADEEIVQSLIA